MQPGVPVGAAWHSGQSAQEGTTGSAVTAGGYADGPTRP
jgi:hypothetical protein